MSKTILLFLLGFLITICFGLLFLPVSASDSYDLASSTDFFVDDILDSESSSSFDSVESFESVLESITRTDFYALLIIVTLGFLLSFVLRFFR